MKKLVIICMLVGLTLLLSGCLVVSFEGGGSLRTVEGTGEKITREFDTWHFTGIDISGEYVVMYSQSQTVTVTIHMQENLFEYLNVGVENGVLRIHSDRPFSTGPRNTPRIYISAPVLEAVHLGGVMTIEDWDLITTRQLGITISGSANGVIPMDVATVEVNTAGAAELTLTGTAPTANITVAGAGTIDALGLLTADAAVVITGAGRADVAVSDTLDVTITGAGTVRYVGNPQVNRSVMGLGSVQRME